MKKNGFTLIELITVIVVIAIIAMISFQAVTSKINKSKERAYNVQVSNIKDAAKKYMLENEVDDPYHLNTMCISLSTLQKKGYLENGEIKNPKTNENFDVDKNYVEVKYNLEKNQYEYSFTDICVVNDEIIPASKKIIENNEIKITNNSDGLYETTDSYVYRGPNPNNYIEINSKLWRIVSIDKETMMMKIINLEDNLMQVPENGFIEELNEDFKNGTTYNKSFKEKINTNSKWNQGIVNSLESSLTLKSIEKQSNSYNTIGLLTVGEYIDASLDKDCYNTNNCISYLSTISTKTNYWLLNKTSDGKSWYITAENKIASSIVNSQLYNIYPCLFLKLNTQIDRGAGTKENPYILK